MDKRAKAVWAVLAAALVLGLFTLSRGRVADVPGGAGGTSGPPRGAGELPRIDLARLDVSRPEASAGRRNVFNFGAAPAAPRPGAGAAEAPPPATVADAPVVTEPTPPPVPPLSVKYIGSVEDKRGLKVAVLMTDKKEILTGRAGDVVANRLRIVRIGLESVDVQDVGSDALRRIPLRGN